MKDIVIIKDKRKRRGISITIKNNGEIILRAPLNTSDSEINRVISEKTPWIEKTISKVLERKNKAELLPKYTDEDIKKLEFAAKSEIPKIVERYSMILGLTYNKISFRTQKTRWGSCSTKKNLNFNIAIMEAPQQVREYLVVHELAHLKHMNHSKKFWDYVEKQIPDYKIWEKWLKTEGKVVMTRLDAWRDERKKENGN